MVRTLDSALTNALTVHTRRPALTLTVEDHVIHYALYQTPGTADGWNDACLASDNSIIRVYVTRGGSGFTSSFQVQCITDPAQATQWASWTTLPGSSGLMFQDGGCAVSNAGGILHAFAQRGTGGNALWVWTSTNNGISWTGPASVLTPPGGALLKGISSAGNNDVFFLYDVSGGEALGCAFYTGGSWSSLTTWTLPTISYGAGLAVAWNSAVYTIVYSDGYSLFSCVYTPAGNTWTSSTVIAPATSTAIGRIGPHLFFADGLYTLTCIEADSGVLTGSVYSYPRLRQSADLVHWSNGTIEHDLSSSFGAVMLKLITPNSGSAGPRYYLASLSSVYSASAFQITNTAQYCDLSASVFSYQRHEQVGKPARVEVTIDNAQGMYNALMTQLTPPTGSSYQPIGLNASLVLSEGYMTGTPPTTKDVISVGTYRITQVHIVRSPTANHLLLIALDASYVLDFLSRYQYVYSNQTMGYLIAEICARAGLFSVVLPTTSQVNQVVSSFVLTAGQSYRHALDELCTTYGLSYFLDQTGTLQFRELSSSDSSVWSYQPEIESVSFSSTAQRANHVIVTGKPPVSGQIGALTTAETIDDAHVHLLGMERLLYHVDPKLTSVAQCGQKATFLLSQEARLQLVHTMTVPLNPALQLLDALNITDSAAPVGSGQSSVCRILALLARYDAQQGLNELQLTLGGL